SSMGDGPITIGRIFAAASAHDDASVVEQPVAAPFAACPGIRGFCFAGGSWACTDAVQAKRHRRGIRKIGCCSMSWLSFPKISRQSYQCGLQSGLYRRKLADGMLPALIA